MSYEVQVDIPGQDPGYKVYIHGLGTFTNGAASLIDEEQAARFQQMGVTQKSETDEKGNMTVTGVLGPDIETFFKDREGFTVKKVADSTDSGTTTPVSNAGDAGTGSDSLSVQSSPAPATPTAKPKGDDQ